MYVPHFHPRGLSNRQMEELKKEINKTEYEKAREPLIKENGKLVDNIYELNEIIKKYRNIIDDILNSIEKDYITIYYQEQPFMVQFGTIDTIATQQPNFKKIEIPIKQGIKEHIISRLREVR